jgi:hypothetical protein
MLAQSLDSFWLFLFVESDVSMGILIYGLFLLFCLVTTYQAVVLVLNTSGLISTCLRFFSDSKEIGGSISTFIQGKKVFGPSQNNMEIWH